MFSLISRFTLRSFWKNRTYHFVSISGLSLAFAAAFLILIWINYEVSYDRFHPKTDNIYRFSIEFQRGEHHTHFARCWQEWVIQMPDYFPEIDQMIRLAPMRNAPVKIGDNKFYSSRFFGTDSSFFNVFGIELILGDPDEVLSEPKSIVLTQSVATKYFGNVNPIGKEILWGHQMDTTSHLYKVTGVMQDFPPNAHFHADMLRSFDDPKQHVGWAYIYVLLEENADSKDILNKFPAFLGQFIDEEHLAENTPHLQPIRDIHLHSEKDREIEQNNKALYIYVFAVVALVLLFIAYINYANLQVASLNKKLGFIFLNRVVGARIRNIASFVGFETLLDFIISSFLGLIITILVLPAFNRFFYYQLDLSLIKIWYQIIGLSILITIFGILTGMISIVLLRIREKIHQMSGRIFYHSGFSVFTPGKGITLRKVMMVIQFAGSIALILITLVMFQQINYMLDKGIGSGQDNILVMRNLPLPALDKYFLFKKELEKSPLVLEVSASMEEPGSMLMDAMRFEMDGFDQANQNQFEFMGVFPVDYNFLDFYDIPLLAGNDFPIYDGTDERQYFILNETGMRQLGFKDPEEVLERPFRLIFQWQDLLKGGKIIGVCEDFHFYSMTKAVKPMVLFQKNIWFWCFLVRIDGQNFNRAIEYVNDTWDNTYPDYPFEFRFVDDLYEDLYRREIVQGKTLGVFSVLTIIIACLGLGGLMMYLAESRTKEIGIRKVNGASLIRIIWLLTKEFMFFIAIAFVIASPLVYIFIKKWLQNFVYRINVDWKLFVLTGISVTILAFLAILIQSYKAASMDPAQSLRYE